jgi:hypothetical protein
MLGLIKENRKPLAVQQMHRPDEFLTAIEMERILKINKTKAYQLIRTRQMSSLSIGKRAVYNYNSLI